MYKLTATQIHQLFIDGQVSAEEIASYFLKRAEDHNDLTGSFLFFLKEKMLKQALLLDEKRKRKEPLGRLAGIPIAIKDNIHVKGEITTCGSKFLKNYRALFDASIIERMDQEGALFIGKTNLDEFAMGSSTEFSAFHPTKNPWNLERSPGGSSGGSAACVASRACPLSLGTDTGGSIRQPAAFNGIFGLKPTYGRVSRFGLVAYGSSLDQIGPFATCVQDLARLMEVIGCYCHRDSTSVRRPSEPYLSLLSRDIKGKKIGVPWNFLKDLKGEIKEAFDNTLKEYEKMGVSVVEINLDELRYSIPTYYIIAPAEASTNLARFDGIQYTTRSSAAKTVDDIYKLSKEEGFGTEVKQRILLGTFVLSSGFQNAYYKKALRVREILINKFHRVFEECDVIALPTTPSSAFKLGTLTDPIERYLQDLYTISANLVGVPAISIPCGFCSSGLPLGFQLMGPEFEEKRLLQFAYHFEQHHSYHKSIPRAFDQEVVR